MLNTWCQRMLNVWDFGEKQVHCMMSKYDSIIGSIVKADVDVYPLPVYRYLETLLVILYPRYYGVNWSYTLVHINTQLFAFRGKYDVSYLLWMKLLGAPVISLLCLWMRSWKWLIYLDTSCFWLKNKAFRNYLVCLLLTKFYCEFLRD